jgi:DNA repair protein RadC
LLVALDPEPELLATRLLYRFGSLAKIVHASETELRQSAEPGETWVDALLMARQLVLDGMREEIVRTRLGDHPQALTSYLLASMQSLREERMIAVFADAGGFVICEEVIAEGEAGHVSVTPRRILGRAMKLDARRILLAHNHPSGCATPSRLDIEYTRVLSSQAAQFGIVIEDHMIVGRGYVVSMRQRGLLPS